MSTTLHNLTHPAPNPVVTLPDGTKQTMSSPPMYHGPSGNAWLSAEEAEFAALSLLSLGAEGKVIPVPGSGVNEGDLGFVLVENGHPTEKAVLVIHPDGSAHSWLPLKSAYDAWEAEHHDLLSHLVDGSMTEDEVKEALAHSHHHDEPEPVSAPAYTTAYGDYM